MHIKVEYSLPRFITTYPRYNNLLRLANQAYWLAWYTSFTNVSCVCAYLCVKERDGANHWWGLNKGSFSLNIDKSSYVSMKHVYWVGLWEKCSCRFSEVIPISNYCSVLRQYLNIINGLLEYGWFWGMWRVRCKNYKLSISGPGRNELFFPHPQHFPRSLPSCFIMSSPPKWWE
jgi:hypothetical protein